MIKQDLSKAIRALNVARLILESGVPDDAVTRAYYAMFHTAKALVKQADPSSSAKSHKGVLIAFGNLYVRTEKVPPDYHARISRAQSARHVADYEGDSITKSEAEDHIAFAQRLFDTALMIIPNDEHPEQRPASLADAMREDASKKALASAFCELVENRGEALPRGFLEDLVLYGETDMLRKLISDVDTMTDLRSYVRERIPVPSLG